MKNSWSSAQESCSPFRFRGTQSAKASRKDALHIYLYADRQTRLKRIDNFDQGAHSIERLEQRIESDAEFRLPDAPTLMTVKTYKQRFVDPLIKKLKEVIREVFYHYYKALDSYHCLNNTNGRLYRENEHLTAANDRLKGENEVLRSELKDFRFLRKILGSRQIDDLIAQAKDME